MEPKRTPTDLALMKRPAAAMNTDCERPETRVACLGDSNTVGGGLGRLNLQ